MIINVRDAANLLKVSQKTVEGWIKDNKIPYQKIGEQYYFERIELFQFAVNEHLNPIPVLNEGSNDENDCSFYESLVRGGIYYNVGGTTKKEALYSALKLVKGLYQITIEPLFELFMAREELASTGIGDGIAIPHARGPLIEYVDYPLVSLSFLENPVEFGALDGKPVNALFLIVSPTVRIHLQILGQIAFALHSPDCMEAVQKRVSAETILQLFKEVENQRKENQKINRTQQ